MSFFPSLDPVSDSPDAGRYERLLHQAAGSPSCSDASEGWSVDDAAAFWLPDWRPPKKKLDSLPADGVMGLATKAFAGFARELPLVGPLFKALIELQRTAWPTVGVYRGITAHSLCCAAHNACGPAGDAISEQLHGTGFRALAEKGFQRCNMPECRHAEPMLGHCLHRAAFDAALRSGFLRSVRSIAVDPLVLLITRLSSWRTCLPYIAVREGSQHVKVLSCPYWVHDAINNLATVVPRLLVDPDVQLLVRSAVATSAAIWLADLNHAHAREQWHRQAKRPIRGPVRSEHDIVASTVEAIWQLNREPSSAMPRYGYAPWV